MELESPDGNLNWKSGCIALVGLASVRQAWMMHGWTSMNTAVRMRQNVAICLSQVDWYSWEGLEFEGYGLVDCCTAFPQLL